MQAKFGWCVCVAITKTCFRINCYLKMNNCVYLPFFYLVDIIAINNNNNNSGYFYICFDAIYAIYA